MCIQDLVSCVHLAGALSVAPGRNVGGLQFKYCLEVGFLLIQILIVSYPDRFRFLVALGDTPYVTGFDKSWLGCTHQANSVSTTNR